MPRSTRSAGGIVLGDHGTIALVRNKKETLWFFPKGRFEPDETDETCARREILEETGLQDIELIDDLGSYTRPHIRSSGEYNLDALKEIHMFLFAAQPHAELKPTMEIEEAAWVSLAHVSESLQDAKDRAWFISVFERVRQAVQRD